MNTAFTCTVDAAAFAKTALAQSKEQTRYYICGVYVEPAPEGQEGVYMAATDGHAMVVRYDLTGICTGSGIVSLDASMLKACTKAQKWSAGSRLIVQGSKACVAWGVTNEDAAELDFAANNVNAVQMRDTLINGNFPDWRRIVPTVTNPDAPIAAMDAGILERMSAALRADGVAKKENGFLSLTQTDGPLSPVLAIGTDPNAFGVVMPVRSDLGTSIPSWFRQPAKTEELETEGA